MALTILGTEVNAETNYAKTLTIPVGTIAIMVLINTGNQHASSYLRIGGLDLTMRGRVASNVYGMEGWTLENLAGMSGSDMTWDGAGTYHSPVASIVYLGGLSAAYLDWESTGLPGACLTHDAPPLSNAVAMAQCISWSGSRSLCPDMTVLHDVGGNSRSGYLVGAEGEALTVGLTGLGIIAVVGSLSMYEDVTTVNPSPFGIEVGMNAGALGATGPKTIYGVGMRAVEVGLNAPSLSSHAKRQVSLVGEGIETVEMTEDGDEGDLLTQHVNRKPSWESPDSHVHGRRWVPAVFRPDPVTYPDDWQLLHADDGSVVMTWVED